MKAEVEDAVAQEKDAKKFAAPPAELTTEQKVWREVVSWFWVIVAFLLIEGMLVQARVIPSGSMENTVLVGDHLIVSRLGYDAGIPFTAIHVPLWRNPKRQQIIVFRAPLPEQGNPDFIKRCIGVPGDHIKIVQGRVFVNGVALNEPYAVHYPERLAGAAENYPPASVDELDAGLTAAWADDFHNHVVNGELVVPAGEYFMMGDNRDDFTDSRVPPDQNGVGYVPFENLVGRAEVIFFSVDGAPAWTFWEWPWTVRWNRLFQLVK